MVRRADQIRRSAEGPTIYPHRSNVGRVNGERVSRLAERDVRQHHRRIRIIRSHVVDEAVLKDDGGLVAYRVTEAEGREGGCHEDKSGQKHSEVWPALWRRSIGAVKVG